MTSEPLIDYRYSAQLAAKRRMLTNPFVGIIFIGIGLAVAYSSVIQDSLSAGLLKSLVFLFGWIFILAGLVHLIAEVLFAIRSRGKDGEWHIFLDQDRFQWLAPEHAHGQETEFTVKLEEIERAEFHTIYRTGDDTRWEHWLKLRGQDALQLHDYSHIGLENVYEALEKAGVSCLDVVRTLDRDHVEINREAVAR